MQQDTQRFGSRWGMMLAMLGMAVGTGNIWRFPRIAAANGGGEFLVAWIVFLLLWSIPLVLLEFGLGRKLRCGPVRAFAQVLGPRFAWLGAFAVLVTCMIGFYYSVVAGWTFRFAAGALAGELPGERPGELWQSFEGTPASLLTHALAIGLATFVVWRGVGAVERVAKVLMPLLVVLVLVLAARALFLPGAGDGLRYLFGVDWGELGKAKIWLEALSQNAWDTGAGWGLVLCYAAYMREGEDTAQNGVILPTANNLISLTAGVMVLCTVFSVVPTLAANLAQDPEALAAYPGLADALQGQAELSPELMRQAIFAQNNEGLTFVWMPELFATLAGGRLFMILFFVALAVAALTSLISMVVLVARVLTDMGVPNQRAVLLVGGACFVFGAPSALVPAILANQDWVWGVALMLSGLFFSFLAIKLGASRFREEELNHADSKLRIGAWWDVIIAFLVPVQALVLFGWWLVQAREWDPDWLAPFGKTNVGTVLLQLSIAFVVLLACNRFLARRSLGER